VGEEWRKEWGKGREIEGEGKGGRGREGIGPPSYC